MNVPLNPGSWSEFLTWFSPVAVVCLAFVVVASVLRFRDWADVRFARAEAARELAELEAGESKVLDRRSSRVRAVEALTGAIDIIAVPIDSTIIAEAPASPDPEAVVLA